MVKLIQNITGANDDEQYKDNHINITQHFESIKDRILNLSEKNYENLAEELTNNTINSAVASSLNPTLSLPQPSSTLPNPFNQGDSHRIEESDTHHNSKGDIAN